MKLQTKIVLLLLPTILLPVLILGYISYKQISDNYTRDNHDRIRTLLMQNENLFKREIETATANIELFSNAKLLNQYLLYMGDDSRHSLMYGPLLRLLTSYQTAYPNYYEIRVIAPDGGEKILKTNRDTIELNRGALKASDILARLDESKEIDFDTAINPENGELALYIAKKISLKNRIFNATAQKTFRGHLLLTIDITWMKLVVNANRIGKTGILFLIDNDGRLIYLPDGSKAEETFGPHAISDANGIKLDDTLMALLRVASSRKKVDTITVGSSKTSISGKKLGDSLYLIAWQPSSELHALKSHLLFSTLIVMLLASTLTILVIIIGLRRFVLRPIYGLEAAAKQIGEGNFSAYINTGGSDEIASLSSSLKQMRIDLQENNQRIHRLAFSDTLTELPNRSMFRKYLAEAVADAKSKRLKMALLFLDIDNFKWVNDTLGHKSGDELLTEVAFRLSSIVRNGDDVFRREDMTGEDIVSRLGGDEFVVLLTAIEDDFTPGQVASRLLRTMENSIQLANHEIRITISIGITLFPDDSEDADELIKNADIAMYDAKRKGKNNYQYFSKELNHAISQRVTLENKLRHAIDNNELCLEYQPQINIATQEIIAVEALLRWRDSNGNMISPADFIPVAEESGLILSIGEWVLEKACQQKKIWFDQGLPDITVAINISSIQFSRKELPNIIRKAMERHKIAPHQIEIELTESIFIHDEKNASIMLAEIRGMGIDISFDDFGTGYCSLAYLRKFPIDCIKIDRNFINEISISKEGEAVIIAIIAMAHAMSLKVVAEGVESEEQLAFLKLQGCDSVQGFHFHRPCPAENISALLENQIKNKNLPT